MNWYDDLPRNLLVEGLNLIVGPLLGSGVDRHVYAYRGRPEWVIKLEASDTKRFQNVAEFHLWREVEHAPKLRPWLAPCILISHSGNFLVMERTWPVVRKDLPKKVPAWLTDTKAENWGRLANGRVVCHDYGFNLAASRGLSRTLHNVKWDI